MFTLEVPERDKGLDAYLTRESTPSGSHTFLFSSIHAASDILSRYILYRMVDRHINEFVRLRHLNASDRRAFVEFYPFAVLPKYLPHIARELTIHFGETPCFNLYGFLCFGIRDIQSQISSILEKGLFEFCATRFPSISLQSVYEDFHACPVLHDELQVTVSRTGALLLHKKKKLLATFDPSSHLSVLDALIDERPHQLTIKGAHELLDKNLTILLKHLFRSRLIFAEDVHA